jgi:hypothetical protein
MFSPAGLEVMTVQEIQGDPDAPVIVRVGKLVVRFLEMAVVVSLSQVTG